MQDNPGGIAEALGLCEKFVDDDNCVVILGDNMFEDSIADDIRNFNSDCRLFFKYVPDGHRYGVGMFDDDKKLQNIVEKPNGVTDAYAAVGIYMYSSKVFDLIKRVEPSYRNELEITSVNNLFLQDDDYELSYSFLQGWWTDAGTMKSYELANRLAMEQPTEESRE